MAHTSASTTVMYCLQPKLPTYQSSNITVHCTQNAKTVTIQLCQYQYPSSNNDWLVHNELEQEVEGSGHGLSEVLLQHFLEGAEKSH